MILIDTKEISEKTEGWPKNRREWKLDVLCERMEEFKNNPTHKNREILIASSSEVYRILSTVRNKILEWALLLEEHEIVGEGMTFTDEEKKKAQNTQIINNYTNNFYSEVSDIEMKQGGAEI